MKVLVLTTWENPKSDEGLKKYYEYLYEHSQYWAERGEKYNVKTSNWSNGTGKVYQLNEFENNEVFAKFYDDEKYQKTGIHLFRLVNNAKMKVLREAIMAPP